MANRWIWCIACLVAWLGVAAADDAVPAPPTPAPTQPAAAPQPTTITGRVTDVLGKPIANARLYVLPASGGRIQGQTDKDGRYSIAVPSGAHAVVIAVDKVHSFRQVLATEGKATPLDVEVEIDSVSGGEVIRIVDRQLPPPAVPPKPTADQRIALPYSEEAVERDAWARAWLLLDVDTTGAVTRLKLLKRPGFDLDQIAIDEAFKLKFEPARDAAGRPTRSYVVWTMEWPSWGWLVTGHGVASGKPNDHDELRQRAKNLRGGIGRATFAQETQVDSPNEDARNRAENLRGELARRPWARPFVVAAPQALSHVPCAGSGPLNLDLRNRAYRDCSPAPDPKAADALPWITRENAETALAELQRAAPKRVKRPRGSRIPEITATAITGGLFVALVISYERYNTYFDRVNDANWRNPGVAQHERNTDRMNRYKDLTLGLVGTVVIGSAVTAFLWSRGQDTESFSVQPTRGGGAVSWGRSF